jgi:hypothetical protein
MRGVRVARAFGSRVAVAAVVVGVVVLVAPVTAWAAGDANQPTCPFETEASPGFRTYLPDCRAYELVTPPYKGGGLLFDEPGAISSDGERVIAGVAGVFAASGNFWPDQNRNPDDAVYEFARTAEGWRPTALTPPATRYPHGGIMAASAADDLETTLWGLATTTVRFNEDIYLREPGGTFAKVGPGVAPEVSGQELSFPGNELTLAGASADLTHSVFSIEAREQDGHSDLWPGDTSTGESLYEYVYRGAPVAEPTLVGVSNPGPLVKDTEAHVISRCGTQLGSSSEGIGGASRDTYNAVSEDGETVVFTARACSDEPGEPAVDELYARAGGAQTVKISEPTAADCSACNTTTGPQNAVFQGASANGEKVFFLTEQELLPGQKGMNLYEYDFNGPEHAKISLASGGEGATEPKVQGVVRVAENGERVYFVAKGTLAGVNGEGKEPEAEADNLYVHEPDPAHPGAYHTVFVAKLLTAAEETALSTEEAAEASTVEKVASERAFRALEEAESHGASFEEAFPIYLEVEGREKHSLKGTLGPAGTLAEDTSVWSVYDNRPAQATADGHFLLFSSSADLTLGDHSKVPQLFEYDAVKQTLSRISIGQGGSYSDDGNASMFHEAAHIPVQKFVSNDRPTAESFGSVLSGDGSRVFFTTAARLAPQSVSGDTNVYEYREGNVYLISDGRDASVAAGSPTVQLFGSDLSGRNAFFLTADPLVPQDGETQEVVYDAREAGGFPAPLVSPGCTGETCRGAVGATPQLASPGSAGQLAGGNVAPPPPPPVSKPAVKPVTRAQKLAKALKACKKKPKRLRPSCERQARKSYGTVKASGKKSNRRGK